MKQPQGFLSRVSRASLILDLHPSQVSSQTLSRRQKTAGSRVPWLSKKEDPEYVKLSWSQRSQQGLHSPYPGDLRQKKMVIRATLPNTRTGTVGTSWGPLSTGTTPLFFFSTPLKSRSSRDLRAKTLVKLRGASPKRNERGFGRRPWRLMPPLTRRFCIGREAGGWVHHRSLFEGDFAPVSSR